MQIVITLLLINNVDKLAQELPQVHGHQQHCASEYFTW